MAPGSTVQAMRLQLAEDDQSAAAAVARAAKETRKADKRAKAKQRRAGPGGEDAVGDVAEATEFGQADIGVAVRVTGYTSSGTIQFVGRHTVSGQPRIGITFQGAQNVHRLW